MRTIATLVLKDLRRRVRSPLTAVILLLFPVAFALLIGVAFGTRGSGPTLPQVEILLVNEDGSLVGQFLGGASGNENFSKHIHLRPVTRAEGDRLMARGKASAMLLIPPGFTDHLLAGQADTLRLWRNPAESAMPFVAQEFAEMVAVVLSSASRVVGEPLAEINGLMRGGQAPPDETVSRIAVSINRAIQDLQPYVKPVLVSVKSGPETAAADTTGAGAGSAKSTSSPGAVLLALYVLPGIAVLSLLMIGQASMRDILRESATGTLRRIFSAPVALSQVVAAKIAASSILALICLVILSGVAVVLGARAVDPAGYITLSLALVLAVGGYGALVYGLARSERQGNTVGEAILMVMAFLGGSWIPLQSLPAGIRRFAPYTLNYWAISGYQRLLFDDARLRNLVANVAILGAVGLLLASAGAVALRRRLMRGG